MTPLSKIRSQLGVKEDTGNNDGQKIAEYLGVGEVSADTSPLPWCAALIVWAYAQCKLVLPGNPWKNRSAREFYKSLRDAGATVRYPESGDIVFFSSRLGSDPGVGQWHVGMVESVGSNNITTIEGNVGDEVRRCHHAKDNPRIVGYMRWPR